jgi:hypothetical protein
LVFSSASTEEEGFSGEVEMVEGGGVFFAGEVAALEVEELFDDGVNHVFNATSVDPNFGGIPVLESDFDEVAFDDGHVAINVAELFHVFAHDVISPVQIVKPIPVEMLVDRPNLIVVLMFESNGEDFEGEIANVDGTVGNFELLKRGFFQIAEPCSLDRFTGVEAGVSPSVVGFVESDDPVIGFLGFFDRFDDEIPRTRLDVRCRWMIMPFVLVDWDDMAWRIDAVGGFDDIALRDLVEVGEEDIGELVDAHVTGWVGGFG